MNKNRIVLIITILVTLLIPCNVFAADVYSEEVNTLGFEDIKPLMMDRNQTILTNLDAANNAGRGSSSLDGMMEGFAAAKDSFNEANVNNPDPTIRMIMLLLDTQYATLNMLGASFSSTSANVDLNVEKGNDMMIYSMENLYLTYNALAEQMNVLQAKKKLVDKSVAVAKVQYSLNMITKTALDKVQSQANELDSAIGQLQDSQKKIVYQFNLGIGQEYNVNLELKENPSVTDEDLNMIRVDEDYADAIDNSFSIRLADDYDNILDETRKFKNDFYQAYNTILEKQKLLAVEKEKLTLAEQNIKFAEVRYKLGLISAIQLESEWSAFITQQAATRTAEYEVYRAYHQYEWAQRGLIMSSGTTS